MLKSIFNSEKCIWEIIKPCIDNMLLGSEFETAYFPYFAHLNLSILNAGNRPFISQTNRKITQKEITF